MTTSVEEANRTATDGGRFEFVRHLGRGGFGTVLLANDKTKGERVAIKCLKAGAASGSLMDYFTSMTSARLADARKEADMLLKLRHPHILGFLKAYEYRDENGKRAIAIVTDFCENGDLYKFLSRGNRPDLSKRLRWFQQLAEGLHYIHNQGIVHRDIKPQNILISGEETLKIADVGLAKTLYDIQSQVGIIDQPFQDYMSSLAGTPNYMAPEVWGQHYNEKSDVFSLGLVFVTVVEYPLLPVAKWSGRELPLGKMYYTIRATRNTKPSHLLQLSKGTPREIRLSDSMLVYDHHVRFSSMDVLKQVKEMITALSEAPVTLQPHVHIEPPPEPSSFSCCS